MRECYAGEGRGGEILSWDNTKKLDVINAPKYLFILVLYLNHIGHSIVVLYVDRVVTVTPMYINGPWLWREYPDS